MTLDQFTQTYEDWKLSGLSVRDYCNNTGFDEGKFYYWRRKLAVPALPEAQGFVPVRMNNPNGKLNITTASKEIESESGSECEIIYANGVTLRINSAISLEVLKSLILLCQLICERVLVHPTFRVIRQSCSANSLSSKYCSSLNPYAVLFNTLILLLIPSTLPVEIWQSYQASIPVR